MNHSFLLTVNSGCKIYFFTAEYKVICSDGTFDYITKVEFDSVPVIFLYVILKRDALIFVCLFFFFAFLNSVLEKKRKSKQQPRKLSKENGMGAI